MKEWTSDGEMRLALNCVGGKETAEMVKLLSMDGFLGQCLQRPVAEFRCLVLSRKEPTFDPMSFSHTVTYGGMARMALSIPPSLFIFKRLTA